VAGNCIFAGEHILILRWLNAHRDTLFVQYDNGNQASICSFNKDWAVLSNNPNIEDFVPAPPVPAFIPNLTFAQMLIGLVTTGWITEAEGDAWSDGNLPIAVTILIGSLPADQRFAAKVRAKRPSVVMRSDPLVNALAATQGRTDAQMDAFFTTYAAI
jgi:hypothetical protein